MSLSFILRVVVGQAVQDEDLAPLRALIEGCQQLVDVLGIQVQEVAVGVGLTDLRQRCNSIGYNLEDGSMHRVSQILRVYLIVVGIKSSQIQ